MMSNTFPVPTLRYQGIRKLFTASIFAADPPQILFFDGDGGLQAIRLPVPRSILPKAFISKRAKKPIHGRFRIEPLRAKLC